MPAKFASLSRHTELFMEWYWYVIIALGLTSAALLAALVSAANAGSKLANLVVGTWVKGNFGRRDDR